jgi:hypothetical protein
MLFSLNSRIGRFLHRRGLARWKAAARAVDGVPLAALEAQTKMASQTLRDVRKFRIAAEDRLMLPLPGSTIFARPSGTDWSWRPEIWRTAYPQGGVAPAFAKDSITNEVVIFHDCKKAEISLRQTRNMRKIDLAPFGLAVEAFHFDGSYLSLVIEIPPLACEGLKKKHLIRLSTVITKERPTNIYARLNVKHGPNTEQVLLTLPDDTDEPMLEFDLAYSQLNEKRAERMWLDLMIESPAMNKITFRDLNFCRYPRAAL